MPFIEVSVVVKNTKFEHDITFDGYEVQDGRYQILKKLPDLPYDDPSMQSIVANALMQLKLKMSGEKDYVKTIGRMFQKAEKQFREQNIIDVYTGVSYIRLTR